MSWQNNNNNKKKKRHVCVGKEKALGVHFCVEMAMAKGNYELNQHECALSAANKGFFESSSWPRSNVQWLRHSES